MSCDRYTGAIVDHACGAEIAADAAAHLRGCAACSRTFEEQRRVLQGLDPSCKRAGNRAIRAVRGATTWRAWSARRRRRRAISGGALLPRRQPCSSWSRSVACDLGDAGRPIVRSRQAAQTAPSANVAGTPAPTRSSAPSVTAKGAPREWGAATSRARDGRARQQPEVDSKRRRAISRHKSRAIERYLTLVRRGALDTSAARESEHDRVAAPDRTGDRAALGRGSYQSRMGNAEPVPASIERGTQIRSVGMRKELVLALTLAGGAMMPVVAQDKPQAPPPAAQPAPSSVARQIPLKVQLTLSRFIGEKKISSTPYMLGVLTNAQKTSLRMGVQVPVTIRDVRQGAGLRRTPQNSYTYRDVGTNIDCEAQDVGNGVFKLVLTIEDSAIQLDRPPDSPQKTSDGS